VRQRTYGLTAAWQVHPKFSVGVTARHQRFLETAATFRYSQQFNPKQFLIQATARENNGQVELKEESDTTFAVGFKWAPTDKLSFGGVYKQGPEFDAPLFYADANTNFEFINAADTKFHMPDIAGVGVSFRPIPVLTINVDAVNVKYSNLVDDFVSATADVEGLDDPFRVEDALELRVGAEYLFSTKIPFALRAGYWRDPAHSVVWNGPVNHFNFIAEALLYPERRTRITSPSAAAWHGSDSRSTSRTTRRSITRSGRSRWSRGFSESAWSAAAAAAAFVCLRAARTYKSGSCGCRTPCFHRNSSNPTSINSNLPSRESRNATIPMAADRSRASSSPRATARDWQVPRPAGP
jgi:hypothetical protein